MSAHIVATVAGRPITVSQLEERMAAIRRGPLGHRLPDDGSPEALRVRRWVVQLLVTEAVVAHEAALVGIAGDPRVAAGQAGMGRSGAADMDDARVAATDVPGPTANGADPIEAHAMGSMVQRLFERVTADVRVAEADVRAYYERNADRYTRADVRRIRHRLYRDEAAARAGAARLLRGGNGAHPSGSPGGPAGRADARDIVEDVRRGDFSGAFEDAVFAAEPGAVVGPVETELGWHVVRVEAVTQGGVAPYEDVRSGIAAELLSAARGKAFDAWLDGRRGVLAAFEPHWVHPGDPALPDLVHRH